MAHLPPGTSRNLNNIAWSHWQPLDEEWFEIQRGDFGPDAKADLLLRLRWHFWRSVWKFAQFRDKRNMK